MASLFSAPKAAAAPVYNVTNAAPAALAPSPPPPPAPTVTSATVQQAGSDAAAAQAQAAGRASTILTGGMGVAGAPSTIKSQLLGG